MKLEPFAMERLQSIWEHRVAWNLSESGVHPLRLDELLAGDEAAREAVLAQPLGYTQTNGTPELRSAIAAMYPGASAANVQVTNGGAEANFISLLALVAPDDEAAVMLPNYMQIPGVVRALGARLVPWRLVEDPGFSGQPGRWRPDLDALDALVGERTRLIAICNPNNPTGARLTRTEVDRICRAAARVGAWVLSDEIYRGAELDGEETCTAWGLYDRVVVTGSLSKAYALPGLRIGWAVGPPDFIEALWGIHDYTTIAPGAINDRAAQIALAPARRELLLARTRGILRTNYPVLRRWIERRAAHLAHIPPEAGAITMVRYRYPIGSSALVERIREAESVLLVPGDHFGMEGYLRVGFGCDPELLIGALDRTGDVLDRLARTEAPAGGDR